MKIMYFIILLGDGDQCRQSRQIIERMDISSTQTKINNKKTSSNKVNHNEEQAGSEDELEENGIDEEAVESGEEAGESEEEARESTREENEFLGDEMEKENVEPDEAAPPSRVSTNLHEQSPRLNTG